MVCSHCPLRRILQETSPTKENGWDHRGQKLYRTGPDRRPSLLNWGERAGRRDFIYSTRKLSRKHLFYIAGCRVLISLVGCWPWLSGVDLGCRWSCLSVVDLVCRVLILLVGCWSWMLVVDLGCRVLILVVRMILVVGCWSCLSGVDLVCLSLIMVVGCWSWSSVVDLYCRMLILVVGCWRGCWV